MLLSMLLVGSVHAQEMPPGVAGARALSGVGVGVGGGTVALTVPLLVQSYRTDHPLKSLSLRMMATTVAVAGTSVATPLLLLGTRRGVRSWQAAGATPSLTGLHLLTTGSVITGTAVGAIVTGFALDRGDRAGGDLLAATGLVLLGTGFMLSTAGALLQWTAFPQATPVLAWTVPLGVRRRH